VESETICYDFMMKKVLECSKNKAGRGRKSPVPKYGTVENAII
jgi:hypothetical protein